MITILSSTIIPIRKLGAYFWQSVRLTVNRLSLVFIFKRLERIIFLIALLAFKTANIYFLDFSRRLEYSFEFDLNNFINKFVPEVELLVLTIYLSLDR